MATNTSHGTEVPAKGGFPAFRVETYGSQLLWLAIAFGLLYLIVSKYVVPQVGGLLEERANRIEGDLAEAQRLKAETDAAIASYEKSLAEARASAQAIADETRTKVNAAAEAERKAIEAKLAADLGAAEAKIAASKTEALGHVRGIALEAAGTIVEQLAGRPAEAGTVEAAVDAALKG